MITTKHGRIIFTARKSSIMYRDNISYIRAITERRKKAAGRVHGGFGQKDTTYWATSSTVRHGFVRLTPDSHRPIAIARAEY